ncbi:MAG: aldose 1-epimerase family protein [Cytophagaceae bacterium]|nr:MAG: aldose 1-epimerase family protein [Cytophagaceae bacterium]
MPTLQNDQCRVHINAHGAELTSFVHLATGLDYLWPADPAQWARHAPLLFPIVGKLPDNTYLHEGQPYKLTQHGFARDQEFELVEAAANSLIFQLVASAATKAIYPFEFELRVRYELRGAALTVGCEVRNPAAAGQELLFSIGAHPAFNCPLRPAADEQFGDYAFHFDHPVTLHRQLLRGGLRSGETSPVVTDSAILPLSYELFADDALVFDHFDFTRLTLQKADKTGPFVRMQFDGFPYLGLWTKGPGAAFACIEPWQGVASPVGPPQELRDKEGILTLAPGQVFSTSYTVEIG